MKFTLVTSLMAAAVSAAPTFNTVQPRAGNSSVSGSITEACNIGYATQNGGTTGGADGPQTTVTSLEELKAAAEAEGPAVIIIDGAITGSDKVDITSDKTVVGAAGSSLEGVGLRVKKASNVIIRNVKISKVLAKAGDAITVQASSNVWLDHLDLSSDRDHDKDFYDGLLDVTHGSDYITISNSYLHDHWKASLVGHSDSNAKEDTGHLIVTYANNYFSNINSRGPSFRFGTGHIYNHYAENSSTGVNTRIGAQLLIESAVFSGIEKPIESADSKTVGFAVVNDVDLASGTNTVKAGTLKSVPYEYELLGSKNVKAAVTATAGQTLQF
ncbi:pectate lyase 2 [Diaporthe helianthi]|uniref:pectate lyase n=1 Tax=Diaporthe helianthi TaxID=158607 RepID=A0A2P5HNS1_DIAHE|nr:pectate lyase 2 [Diaporthe helianthi]